LLSQARVISSNPRAGKYAYDVFFVSTGAPAARPAVAAARPGTGDAGLLGVLALILLGLLSAAGLVIRRRRRRPADLASVGTGEAQPCERQPDLISMS
jgi:LPXTG-motif cell wall-anchored protein